MTDDNNNIFSAESWADAENLPSTEQAEQAIIDDVDFFSENESVIESNDTIMDEDSEIEIQKPQSKNSKTRKRTSDSVSQSEEESTVITKKRNKAIYEYEKPYNAATRDYPTSTSATLELHPPPKTTPSPFLPTNSTLNSHGKGNSIIITPVGENAQSFCYSPIAIARGLKQDPFNKITPKEVRINKRRNLIAIEVYDSDKPKIEILKLLEVTKLGKFDVTCRRPLNEVVCSGVIGPVEADISVKEIQEALKCYSTAILKVTRLNRFNKSKHINRKEPSLSVKIDFHGDVLPRKVYLENIAFTVRKYNLPPLKCYKCQKGGHMSSGCRGEDVCNICSGNHRMQDCKAASPKCANCSGPHAASSRDCQQNIDAKKVEALRSQGSSFTAARKSIKTKRAQQILTERGIEAPLTQYSKLKKINVTAEVHQSQGSYSDVLKGATPGTPGPQNQREPPEENFETIKKYVDETISLMTIKIASFLQEVLSLQMQKENQRERKLLLMNLAKHHFGINIREEMLQPHLEFSLPNSCIEYDNESPQSQILSMRPTKKKDTAETDVNQVDDPQSQILKTRKPATQSNQTWSVNKTKQSKRGTANKDVRRSTRRGNHGSK